MIRPLACRDREPKDLSERSRYRDSSSSYREGGGGGGGGSGGGGGGGGGDGGGGGREWPRGDYGRDSCRENSRDGTEGGGVTGGSRRGPAPLKGFQDELSSYGETAVPLLTYFHPTYL